MNNKQPTINDFQIGDIVEIVKIQQYDHDWEIGSIGQVVGIIKGNKHSYLQINWITKSKKAVQGDGGFYPNYFKVIGWNPLDSQILQRERNEGRISNIQYLEYKYKLETQTGVLQI